MDEEYKKCVVSKQLEICKIAIEERISNGKKEINICDNIDSEIQTRSSAEIYCRDKIKQFRYPRFK
jgi:hypothetical protein